MGASSTTLREWLSILEASFIIFKLEPYFENFGKRVIKSPKVYFTDTGLLAYLLDIDSPSVVSRDPLIGNIFENLVILEILKNRLNRGLSPNIYFFRDSNGFEVDLIYKKAALLIPVEIKSSSTFHSAFSKGIKKFLTLTNTKIRGFVIYSGEFLPSSDQYEVINYTDITKIFES